MVNLLESVNLAGVVFEPVNFVPEQKPYHGRPPELAGQALKGVRMQIVARDGFEPYRVGVAMLWAVHKLHPDRLVWNDAVLDRLVATTRLKTMLVEGRSPAEIFASWRGEVDAFSARSAPYRLYR